MIKGSKGLSWFIWLAIWQIVSLLCANEILLVGPWETLVALVWNVQEIQFLCKVSQKRGKTRKRVTKTAKKDAVHDTGKRTPTPRQVQKEK